MGSLFNRFWVDVMHYPGGMCLGFEIEATDWRQAEQIAIKKYRESNEARGIEIAESAEIQTGIIEEDL